MLVGAEVVAGAPAAESYRPRSDQTLARRHLRLSVTVVQVIAVVDEAGSATVCAV